MADSSAAGDSTEGSSRSKRTSVLRGRVGVIAIVGVVVVLVALVIGVVLTTSDSDGTADAEEVAGELEAIVAEAQQAAETAEGDRLDVIALRDQLEAALDGWRIDMDAPADRTVVGVAARRLDAPVCVFVWSEIGGPRSAIVDDPDLPCLGEIARVAAG